MTSSPDTPGRHEAPEYDVVSPTAVEPKTKAGALGAGGGAIVAAFIDYLLDAWLWNGDSIPPAVPLPVSAFVGLVVTAGGAFLASYFARHVNREPQA